MLKRKTVLFKNFKDLTSETQLAVHHILFNIYYGKAFFACNTRNGELRLTAGAFWFTTTKETVSKKSKTSKTSKTTKTAKETDFAADKLHAPVNSEKFKSKKTYKVTSDTTYLNLRFGPSKKYNVQLKIPDGTRIYGTAKTKTNGEGWIYVTYKGTSGWVMESLLKAE